MLKIIPRPVHAALDYIYAAKAFAAPKLMGFEDNKTARNLSYVLGLGALATGVFSKHEGGLVKVIPFNTHLKGDAVGAVLALASPWLLGFADDKRARNTIIALALIEATAFLLTRPDN